jgi:transposase, IS5 family
MQQVTLTTGTLEPFRKATRREIFLSEMDRVVPWTESCALIAPVYPKAGNGRPPIGLERMPRTCFLQQWFNLSDPGARRRSRLGRAGPLR